jgi:hypothetical protein
MSRRTLRKTFSDMLEGMDYVPIPEAVLKAPTTPSPVLPAFYGTATNGGKGAQRRRTRTRQDPASVGGTLKAIDAPWQAGTGARPELDRTFSAVAKLLEPQNVGRGRGRIRLFG